jgi:hypothetical protein
MYLIAIVIRLILRRMKKNKIDSNSGITSTKNNDSQIIKP